MSAVLKESGAKNRSILGVSSLEHRRKTSRLFLATLFGARLFEPAPKPELLERLFTVQLFLEPADRFLHRFTFF